MFVKVQKWGNSLALRIPKTFAREINLEPDTMVNLTVREGKLVIEKVSEYKLNELLSEVNESNIHSEYSTGKPSGKEIW